MFLVIFHLQRVSCDIPPTKSFLEWRLSEESIELVSAIEWEELSWTVDCTNLLMSCKSSTPQCDINTYIWVKQWSYSSVKHSTILSYHSISYITCTTFYYQSNHFHLYILLSIEPFSLDWSFHMYYRLLWCYHKMKRRNEECLFQKQFKSLLWIILSSMKERRTYLDNTIEQLILLQINRIKLIHQTMN